jgi:putative colanic acid biosynthesis UDP-glucose lipid carrier transferase
MRTPIPLITFIYRLVDSGIIYVAGFLALYIRFGNSSVPNNVYDIFILGACVIYLLISSQVVRKKYDSLIQNIAVISRIWLILFLTISLLIIFTQSGNLLSRIWLVIWAVVAWLGLIAGNLLVEYSSRSLYGNKLNKKKVAVIGQGIIAEQLINQIDHHPHAEFRLITVVSNLDDQSTIEELSRQLLDEIWVALPISQAGKLPEIIHSLGSSSASIKYAPDLFTLRLINHGSTEILGINMLNLNASPFSGEALIVKNIEDVVISLLILIILSPLLMVLAIGVKVSSPGPIFYQQERVGLNGRPFKMLKFRSMPVDVEKDGVRWGNSEAKTANPFSRWMRRLNLDELPQFFNVLRGQMSIVGPRPERVEFIEQFSREIPNYAKKHLVKAGITGWAQIHGLRGDTDLNKRIEYDLFYIENWSLMLDLKIILLTAFEPFLPKNGSTR